MKLQRKDVIYHYINLLSFEIVFEHCQGRPLVHICVQRFRVEEDTPTKKAKKAGSGKKALWNQNNRRLDGLMWKLFDRVNSGGGAALPVQDAAETSDDGESNASVNSQGNTGAETAQGPFVSQIPRAETVPDALHNEGESRAPVDSQDDTGAEPAKEALISQVPRAETVPDVPYNDGDSRASIDSQGNTGAETVREPLISQIPRAVTVPDVPYNEGESHAPVGSQDNSGAGSAQEVLGSQAPPPRTYAVSNVQHVDNQSVPLQRAHILRYLQGDHQSPEPVSEQVNRINSKSPQAPAEENELPNGNRHSNLVDRRVNAVDRSDIERESSSGGPYSQSATPDHQNSTQVESQSKNASENNGADEGQGIVHITEQSKRTADAKVESRGAPLSHETQNGIVKRTSYPGGSTPEPKRIKLSHNNTDSQVQHSETDMASTDSQERERAHVQVIEKPHPIHSRNDRSDPWACATNIARTEVRIPQDQNELLENFRCWMPPAPGKTIPQGQVPPSLLAKWNEIALRRQHAEMNGDGKELEDFRSWMPPAPGKDIPQDQVSPSLIEEWDAKALRMQQAKMNRDGRSRSPQLRESSVPDPSSPVHQSDSGSTSDESEQYSWTDSDRSAADIPEDSPPRKGVSEGRPDPFHEQAEQVRDDREQDAASIGNDGRNKVDAAQNGNVDDELGRQGTTVETPPAIVEGTKDRLDIAAVHENSQCEEQNASPHATTRTGTETAKGTSEINVTPHREDRVLRMQPSTPEQTNTSGAQAAEGESDSDGAMDISVPLALQNSSQIESEESEAEQEMASSNASHSFPSTEEQIQVTVTPATDLKRRRLDRYKKPDSAWTVHASQQPSSSEPAKSSSQSRILNTYLSREAQEQGALSQETAASSIGRHERGPVDGIGTQLSGESLVTVDTMFQSQAAFDSSGSNSHGQSMNVESSVPQGDRNPSDARESQASVQGDNANIELSGVRDSQSGLDSSGNNVHSQDSGVESSAARNVGNAGDAQGKSPIPDHRRGTNIQDSQATFDSSGNNSHGHSTDMESSATRDGGNADHAQSNPLVPIHQSQNVGSSAAKDSRNADHSQGKSPAPVHNHSAEMEVSGIKDSQATVDSSANYYHGHNGNMDTLTVQDGGNAERPGDDLPVQGIKRSRSESEENEMRMVSQPKRYQYDWTQGYDEVEIKCEDEYKPVIGDVVSRREDYMENSSKRAQARRVHEKFQSDYPTYAGDFSHFIEFCGRLQSLRERKELRRAFLWDDFILIHLKEYPTYVKRCRSTNTEPLRYEDYFIRTSDKPVHKKRSLTLSRLETAAAQYGLSSRSSVVSLRLEGEQRPGERDAHASPSTSSNLYRPTNLHARSVRDSQSSLSISANTGPMSTSPQAPDRTRENPTGRREATNLAPAQPEVMNAAQQPPKPATVHDSYTNEPAIEYEGTTTDEDDLIEETHETASVELGDDPQEKPQLPISTTIEVMINERYDHERQPQPQPQQQKQQQHQDKKGKGQEQEQKRIIISEKQLQKEKEKKRKTKKDNNNWFSSMANLTSSSKEQTWSDSPNTPFKAWARADQNVLIDRKYRDGYPMPVDEKGVIQPGPSHFPVMFGLDDDKRRYNSKR